LKPTFSSSAFWVKTDASDSPGLASKPAICATPSGQQYSRGDKVATNVDLPLSGEAKRVLAYAAEEADRIAHSHMGTEHLFLGMLHEPDCLAFRMVKSRGEDLNNVRAALLRMHKGLK
jgi:ATP-dependent Clp protease ATP-binding subunit ClpA